MLINLGALESSENHLDLAKQHLQEALKKEPDQPFALIELANISIKQSDFRAARDLLGRAAKIDLVAGQAHELTAVLENKEQGKADLARMRLAAHSGSSSWAREKRYIKLLAETGATDAAIHELQGCLRTEWYRAESWQLLGQLLSMTGRTKEAAEAIALANNYDVHLASRPAPL
jgi:predicted Zn-dependent protease